MKFKYDRHDRKELVALKKKYDSKLKAMKGNYEAIIFNPVKYATFIEYGTRKMQPQSMVRKNMANKTPEKITYRLWPLKMGRVHLELKEWL